MTELQFTLNGSPRCVGDQPASRMTLDWLRAHPEQARAMGERGREFVASFYNWEGEAERLMAFYQRLGGSRTD